MALHWAASAGHVDVVKYLLQQGAQVDARDEVRIDMYINWHTCGVGLCHPTIIIPPNVMCS